VIDSAEALVALDASKLEPTADTALAAVSVRESDAARARSLDGAVNLVSCPLACPGELAAGVCAGFGITSQDACFVLEVAGTGSVCRLPSPSDEYLEVVPWMGGLARFPGD